MKLILGLLFLFFGLSSSAQKIEMLKFDELSKRVNLVNDTVYVLNFWATWCKPCIEELPFFEKCDLEYKDKPVKLFLVNLDFNSQMNGVKNFVRIKKIHSTVKHISDTNSNLWINKVDSTWSGAIPATVMYKNRKKNFFKEGAMTEKELKEVLDAKLAE